MGNHNVLPAMAVQRWVYIKYFCALSVVVSHLCKLIYLGPAFSQFFDFGTYAVAIFFFRGMDYHILVFIRKII